MKPIIYLIPIEPLTERYSESWYRNIPKAFAKAGYEPIIIDGQPLLEDDIKVGTFLDISSTCHYKATQLQAIAKLFNEGKVEKGSSFFFYDVEFWGIEQVRLLADMNKVDVVLTGFLHAGSYTIGDAFEIAKDYQRYTEVGWVAALDKVFVGSSYHRQAFIERRLHPIDADHLSTKIVVTKNPMFEDDYEFNGLPKEKRILLTNRFDAEKNCHETISLFADLSESHPDWKFIVTTSRKKFRTNYSEDVLDSILQTAKQNNIEFKVGLTKEQYHEELEKAAIVVSHSPEENYGICVAESIIYKCYPLLKNCASHPEFVGYDSDYLFDYNGITKAEGLMSRFEEGQICTLELDWSGITNVINNISELNKNKIVSTAVDFKVDLDSGKYTYIRYLDGHQKVLRYGEPWREEDLIGDNFVAAMGYEIEKLKGLINNAN